MGDAEAYFIPTWNIPILLCILDFCKQNLAVPVTHYKKLQDLGLCLKLCHVISNLMGITSINLKIYFLECSSDHENYFWHAGQNVRQAFSTLPDIFSSCQTLSQLTTGKYQSPFLFSLSDILCVLNPAGQNVSARHQQKSAGHVRHISRSLV